MKRIVCYITILVIFSLGLAAYTQHEYTQASGSESNTMPVSASESVSQEVGVISTPASIILSGAKPVRSQTSGLRGCWMPLFLIYGAVFSGLNFRSLSAIFSLCLLFTADRLLRLKVRHMQDGEKGVLCPKS